MNIVCPHCMTSYAVDPANFAGSGRRVRCVRCHEIWLAVPQEMATTAQSAWAPQDDGYTRHEADHEWQSDDAPHVESPSISADWTDPNPTQPPIPADQDWAALAQQDAASQTATPVGSRSRFRNPLAPLFTKSSITRKSSSRGGLPITCMALGAAVFALLAWRADVVRMMPQTAAFYRAIGMGVNLRGLAFEDVKISTEIVNDKPVLLIEGAIIDVARRSVEIPRLRFIVRDANGLDIYAWNAVLEQPVINPGEKAWFKTRLASPPAEGREIAVRFFHKLDVAAGGN